MAFHFRALRIGFATAVLGLAAPVPCLATQVAKTASPFDGLWRIDYSCKGATNDYAVRCAAGNRDYLELNLAVSNGKICGGGGATAQMQNREGGVAVIGTVEGSRALVNWDILGGHGKGRLDLRGRTLVFDLGAATPDDNSGWSFPPAGRIVLKWRGVADPKLAICSPDVPA